MKTSHSLSGQTIIEILIATTLISLSILAALSLNNNSQKSSSYARDLHSATTYNNQVVDWLRNLRTTIGWSALTSELRKDTGSDTLTYCLNSLPSTTNEFVNLGDGSCASDSFISGTSFSRQAVFNLTDLASNSLAVTVTTSWQLHSTSTETVLNNW